MSTGNAARGDLPAADVVTTTTTSASPSLTDGPALPPAPPLVPLTALTPLGGADGEAGWCVDGVCVVPPSG
ncbi:hypothetical protein [Georgenia faecalis]|uniref:Uncharacterized protein n=1 Tax=Georgenia faecalis TaxID=2483799 RepID=A0ABV9DBP8_9MICO|nr:hypothetical protein [Georgenia faecalis]